MLRSTLSYNTAHRSLSHSRTYCCASNSHPASALAAQPHRTPSRRHTWPPTSKDTRLAPNNGDTRPTKSGRSCCCNGSQSYVGNIIWTLQKHPRTHRHTCCRHPLGLLLQGCELQRSHSQMHFCFQPQSTTYSPTAHKAAVRCCCTLM